MLQRCLTAETLEVSAMCCTHRSTRHCTKLVNKYTQQLNKRRLHRSPNAIWPAVWVRLNQHLTDKYHSQTHDASYYYYYYPTSQKKQDIWFLLITSINFRPIFKTLSPLHSAAATAVMLLIIIIIRQFVRRRIMSIKSLQGCRNLSNIEVSGVSRKRRHFGHYYY